MAITSKEYKCEGCGNITTITTNHNGSFRGCKKCNDKRAYLVCQTKEGIDLFTKQQKEKQKLRDLLPKSILHTTTQKKEYRKYTSFGHITVKIRWDDTCNNNHNSFSITGDTYSSKENESDEYSLYGGCIHDEIIKYFPEFQHLINWHYFTSDGYLYVSDISYHANNGDLEAARSCANWSDATIEQLKNEDILMERLPRLMQQMKNDIEALGFMY